NDGCVVFAISPRSSAALANAEHSTLHDIAVSWSQLRAEDGEVIDTEVADAIVGDLAALVISAQRQGQASTAGPDRHSCAEPDRGARCGGAGEIDDVVLLRVI
ncbi:hypothetical protein M4J07_008837, partial [Streptomyces longispororuber]|nr:hypothetical protein [Streptomyces longispororuber]